MMRFVVVLMILCGCGITGFAQPSFITDSLENYIKRGMKDYHIPGLAIAIVKDGKVVLSKGYGVQDLDTKIPVTENTLFMIASNSKLFTGTALAQLEYDEKLLLDDKITKYFPWFRAYDSTTTKLVTIRDMLGHHLGTKTFQGDFSFWGSTLSRDSIIYKMRYLKPEYAFRTTEGYCNSCFLTAGEIIQKVTRKPWEVYVYDSLIAPIGMINTHALSTGMTIMPNAATPYSNGFSEELTKLPYDNIDNLAPAGSMVSNVKDLSRWLLLQLDSGRLDGKQIIPWEVLEKTRAVNSLVSATKNKWLPSHFQTYGLGVYSSDFNGRQVYYHTGGADGFVTNVCFVPEENLGITILTNNDNQYFFELLRYQILAAYTNFAYTDYSKLFLGQFNEGRKADMDTLAALRARVKGLKPLLPLESYEGNYTNHLFGNLEISVKGSDLFIDFGNHKDLTATLQYMSNDEWLMTYNNLAFGIFKIKFLIKNKKVVSVDIKVNEELEHDAYTFTKG